VFVVSNSLLHNTKFRILVKGYPLVFFFLISAVVFWLSSKDHRAEFFQIVSNVWLAIRMHTGAQWQRCWQGTDELPVSGDEERRGKLLYAKLQWLQEICTRSQFSMKFCIAAGIKQFVYKGNFQNCSHRLRCCSMIWSNVLRGDFRFKPVWNVSNILKCLPRNSVFSKDCLTMRGKICMWRGGLYLRGEVRNYAKFLSENRKERDHLEERRVDGRVG